MHSTGAKRRKIIPIIYKKCQVPDSMANLASVDYSRQDVIEWFWNRLKTALENDFNFNPFVQEKKLPSVADAEPTVTNPPNRTGLRRFFFRR